MKKSSVKGSSSKTSTRGSSRRRIYITSDGTVKVRTEVLLCAELRKMLDELAKRFNKSISDLVNCAVRLYTAIVNVLGREPTPDEVTKIVTQFVTYRKLINEVLSRVTLPQITDDDEATVVKVLLSNYLSTGEASVVIRNDEDSLSVFGMTMFDLANAVVRLRNKGIVYVVKDPNIRGYKIGLKKSYVEKVLTMQTQGPSPIM